MVSTFPPRRCGIGDYTADLGHALAETGMVRLRMITYGDGRPETEELTGDILVSRTLRTRMTRKQVERLLGDHQPDLVHLQSSTFLHHPSINTSLATSWEGGLVVTAHDSPRSWRLFYTIPSMRRLYRRASRIIVHSAEVRRTISSFHGIEAIKIVTMPHGVETMTYRPQGKRSSEMRAQLGLGGKRIVLFFGFLRPGKGLEVLLKAWALVERRQRDTILVIAGGTPSRPRRYAMFAQNEAKYPKGLQQLAKRLGISDRVVFTGYVSPEIVPELMAEAEIVTLPYQGRVSQSGPLHKALSAGKPIIATRLAGFQQVLAKHGHAILIDPGDVKSLASWISELLDDSETAREMGRRGREYALAHFDWSTVASRTIECYSSVLDSR